MFRKQIVYGAFFYWFPLVMYMGIIFYLSHQSDPTPGISIPVSDKVVHVAEFFILQLLAIRAFCFARPVKSQRQWLLASIVFCCVYALSDEFHQFFVPERESSLFDFIADSAGIFLSVIMHSFINFLR